MTKKNATTPPIRDLADFHLRWREFRAIAVAARDKRALTAEERTVLEWLIRMADRIGPRDIT